MFSLRNQIKTRSHFRCKTNIYFPTFLYILFSVRQLAPPVSSELVVAESPEFGCLFNTPCQVMSDEQVYKFVHNTKTFTKVNMFSS